MRTVLLDLVTIPLVSPPPEDRAHDHDAAGKASAGAFARHAATGGQPASSLEYAIVSYAQGILNSRYRALAAPCDGFFIFETQRKGALNDLRFVLKGTLHRLTAPLMAGRT
jgi:hypothetical protein